MRHAAVAVSVVAAMLVVVSAAGATVTSVDANGTVFLNGAKVFPIVLAKGPPRGGTTPAGADALHEAVDAGVNFFKVGPATTPWTSADITDAVQWDQAAAAVGAYTWINLATVSQATPGSSTDSLLQQVVTTLKGDSTGSAGIGMWRGADEPWWSSIPPSALQFSYCRSTGRGDPSWCAGEPWLDNDHLWVTVEAPKGTTSDLSPYSAVTDAHGVDDYPVTLAATNPDLHQVGFWTSTIAAATPNHAVWTSLQVCASGSYNASGTYVLPTLLQERYMVYDAIINGARSLAFYGGNNPNCWNSADTTYGWSWTFWNDVLKGLIQEINAQSPLAPALVDPGSTQTLNANDSTTEAISRQGSTPTDLWVIASRSGSGSQPVTISGLPSNITTGTVYTENRSISVDHGSFTDTFGQWGVHVYRFNIGTTNTTSPPVNTQQPTIGGSAQVGATLTAANGAWGGVPTPSLADQWQRCDSAGANCTDIAGASSQTYVPADVDVGKRIRVEVTGTNSVSSVKADSAATGAITAPLPSTSVPPAGTGTTAVVTTPPSGGGGGGGGISPDLHVDLTASAATAPPVGSEIVYSAKVSMKNLGNASAVSLDVNLPEGFTVTRIYSDRGPGCAGGAPRLTCDVAWVVPGVSSTVTIWGTVGAAGPLVASATAASVVEPELASTLADNTAVLRIAPPVVTPTHRGPPILRSRGGAFTPPGAARVGRVAIVKASVAVDEPAMLRVSVANDNAKQLTLLARSQVGGVTAARSQPRLVYNLAAAGNVKLALRVGNAIRKRGRSYRIVVVATAADGQSSRLVIPFS